MPTIHRFDSTGEAYDASQCDDDIADGDVLSVPSERVVGILLEAWPVAISPLHGEFHTVAVPEFDWSAVPSVSDETVLKDYSESYGLAVREALEIAASSL